ncbi:MAG: hypothetical protein ACE5H0_15075 [Bacteroidota bacterium]
MRIAIDTNVLVDCEQAAARAEVLNSLARQGYPRGHELCVPAIVASERGLEGVLVKNFAEFESRLSAIGLVDVELLSPMLYLDVCFLGHALLCNDEMKVLEQEIHEVLFPSLPFVYADYCANAGIEPAADRCDRKWRNAKCDVQVVWAHVWHQTDALVSADSNMHKTSKKSRLENLTGGRPILHPNDLPSFLAAAAV